MIRIGLLGSRGYVGEELLHLLQPIPEYQIGLIGSRQRAGQPVSTVHPHLSDSQMIFSDLEPNTLRQADIDVWVIAQANGVAAKLVDVFDDRPGHTSNCKIIDVSADHRFHEDWVYGLPEKNRAMLGNATRVANPGCYATAGQLALLPLLSQIQTPPTLFGVSGFSGAGRTPSEKNDPKRLADNLLPYALSNHLHQQEMSEHLGCQVRFTPHVASFFRGISMTVMVQLGEPTSSSRLLEQYRDFYEQMPGVQVTAEVPEIREVAGTNLCRIGGFSVDETDPRNVVLVSTLDNLRKGAATQAVQNMNLMFGLESTRGLEI